MTAYGLLMCAYVFDVLDIGLIGKRGRLVLVLVAAALADAWWTGPAGWCGVVAGVVTVAGVRRLGQWLRHEGGLALLGLLLLELAEQLARFAGDCLRRVCEVLTPPYRGDTQEPIFDAQPERAGLVRTSTAVGSGWQRWTTSGPGDVPDAVRELNQTMGYAVRGTVDEPEVLHNVETYSDWLTTAVDTCGGANAAAREAKHRWGVGRTKFYNDLRDLRTPVAA